MAFALGVIVEIALCGCERNPEVAHEVTYTPDPASPEPVVKTTPYPWVLPGEDPNLLHRVTRRRIDGHDCATNVYARMDAEGNDVLSTVAACDGRLQNVPVSVEMYVGDPTNPEGERRGIGRVSMPAPCKEHTSVQAVFVRGSSPYGAISYEYADASC